MARLRVRSAPSAAVPFADGSAAYAFNGEIYDADGSTPAGGLEEARRCGPDADGMYAVIRSERAAELDVERDRHGIKPLFVRESADGVALASEVGPLVDAFGRAPVRRDAIAQFLLTGRRVVDGGSFHEGIRPVAPGERLTISHGRVTATHPLVDDDPAEHVETTAAELREAAELAVDRVLVADRPLGLALSGGLDSTILAALLARRGITDLPTVSICPEGNDDGLRSLSELQLPGTSSWRHRWAPFDGVDLLEGLPSAVRTMGEPSGMSSLPMYARLADLARDSGITVLVVGEGADELFAGYQRYLPLYSGAVESAIDMYLSPDRTALTAELLGTDATERAAEAVRRALPAGPAIEAVRLHEREHSLEPLLRRTDHMLMAHGIEGRTPFMHGGLPALAARCSSSSLVRDGQTKVALREAFADVLPPRSLHTAKRPFRAPVQRWLGGSLLARVDASLLDGTELLAAHTGVLPDGVGKLRKHLAQGHEAAFSMAFCLLTTIEWLTQLEDSR